MAGYALHLNPSGSNNMLVLKALSFVALVASLVSTHPATGHADSKRANIDNYEYIVVGSGAGGGVLAARLAINGARVLLLEAGDDQGTSVQESTPAFFAAASEYAPMSWDFFVRHYSDDAREKLNTKATYQTPDGQTYVGLSPPAGSTFKGIWYPRAATLGGCGAHNAMVTVYPHEKDWTNIQSITGDASWSATNMRKYFQRIEKNGYISRSNAAASNGHGFDGWLGTAVVANELVVPDKQLSGILGSAAAISSGKPAKNITTSADLDAIFPVDVNTYFAGRDSTNGFYRNPAAISNAGARSSPRDFLLATAAAVNADGSKKYNLTIQLNTFVTKIRFSSDKVPVALGVEYLQGSSQYSADPRASTASKGTAGFVQAGREVILAGGTFNTPQILKLSGVGPAKELKSFGLSVVSDLAGVGTNLQDHYEISTVVQFPDDFAILNGCTFLTTNDDSCYAKYVSGSFANGGKGLYATNLVPAAELHKSSVSDGTRDTFLFGGPIKFTGYFQGYTAAALADHRHWSWLSLKSHTRNTAGVVTLKSANPLDTPNINFNFYDAGTTAGGVADKDLQAQAEGIAWTRKVYANLPKPYGNFTEVYPGPSVKTDKQVKDFIKNESWGHHATGTARIGKKTDAGAVVDGNFNVYGVKGLRVVDASVFPQVPGFFPVVSVYMIAEKAADVILGL